MERQASPATGGRARGRVTETGWGLAALAATSYVVGSRYHWPELVLLATTAGLVGVLGLVVVLVPRGVRAGLHLRPSRVTVGGRATAVVEVHGSWARLVPPRIEVPTAGEPSRAGSGPTRRGGRGHRDSGQVVIDLPTDRRGVIQVGPVTHVRTDPLGLFTRRRELGQTVPLHVRPVVTQLPSLASGIVHDLEGVASNKLAASDLSFHALREYEPGDDPRHIHWKSTARAGSLLVRQFQLTRRSHATVLLDASPGSYTGDDEFELAVSVATSVALRALTDDYEVTFGCGGDIITTREPQPMLDAACRLRRDGQTVRQMGVRVATEAGSTSLVVVVSGSRSDPTEARHGISHLPSAADSFIVRADVSGEPRAVRTDTHTLVVVSQLDQLFSLLGRTAS